MMALNKHATIDSDDRRMFSVSACCGRGEVDLRPEKCRKGYLLPCLHGMKTTSYSIEIDNL